MTMVNGARFVPVAPAEAPSPPAPADHSSPLEVLVTIAFVAVIYLVLGFLLGLLAAAIW